LAALALFMLLLFEPPAGTASACILASGILVLLLSLLHALLRASQISRRSRSEPSQAPYENDSAPRAGGDLNNKNAAAPPRPRPEIHREFSFPLFPERKSQPGSASSSNLSCSPGRRRSEKELQQEFQQEFQREFQQEWRGLARAHRTLSAESGLLQAQGKPWNVIPQEMRNVASRKPAGKDSTLV
ncbi:TM221 protein, partial [Dryoscopus gambensis]|nr:TM221 protein [Dryoscopus gambensis]